MAIILRANKDSLELGGHIASFQSAATLYDIGFGHFWHVKIWRHERCTAALARVLNLTVRAGVQAS